MCWQVQTDIPHGNAACCEIKRDGAVSSIFFSADPHGGTESLWWFFRVVRTVSSPVESERLRLVWRHFTNCLGMGDMATASRIHPVVKVDGGDWKRLSEGKIEDRGSGCPELVWEINSPVEQLEAAFCFPHGVGQVDDLASESGWHRDSIGISGNGREIVRLANDYGISDGKRPGVYCVSHQHASEMSGAWVLHGFILEMARRGDKAPLVWSIPLLNVDGVVEGDYGKDPFPWDLNRAWGYPPMRVEVGSAMRDMNVWRSRCCPQLCLDFHSPGGAEGDGVYTFLADPADDPEANARGREWAELLKRGLGEYAADDFARVANYPSRFVSEQYTNFGRFSSQGTSLGMSFETPYHRIGEEVLGIDDYLAIGARMAGTISDAIRFPTANAV